MMKRTRTYNVTFTADVDNAIAHVTQYDIEARSRKQAIRRARRVTHLPADELNRAEITTEITA